MTTLTLDETLEAIDRLRANAETCCSALQKQVGGTAHGEMHGRLHRLWVIVRELAALLANTPAPEVSKS